MTDRDYERWTELQDRQATGATLSAAERDFCAQMIANHPLCAREDTLLSELARLEGESDAGAREREDAVLAAIWNETPITTHDDATVIAAAAPSRVRTWVKLGATLVAAAAVALAVGAGITRLRDGQEVAKVEPQPSRVELVYSSGNVQIDTRQAAFGQLLSEGSVVRVSEGAACLAIDPGIDVCLGKESTLRITRTKVADRRVDLLEGSATAAIDPQPSGARFSIVASGVWSTAVGTAFSVAHDKNGHVDTVVLSGKVLVGAEGKQQIVSAHQQAKSLGDKATVSPIARSQEAPYWAAIKTTELWRDPKTSTLVIEDADTHAALWLNGEEIGVSPLSSLIPAGEHRLTGVFQDGTSIERTFLVAAGKSWTFDLGAAYAEALAADAFRNRVVAAPLPSIKQAQPVTTEITPASELLALARQQLRQQDWNGAAATYRQVRALHGESAEGKTVLVSLAQLSLERLNQPSAALHDLDTYLALGGGALTQEARYLRIAALRAIGKTAVAQDAARAFLDDYPTSFQATTLRNELLTPIAPATAPATQR